MELKKQQEYEYLFSSFNDTVKLVERFYKKRDEQREAATQYLKRVLPPVESLLSSEDQKFLRIPSRFRNTADLARADQIKSKINKIESSCYNKADETRSYKFKIPGIDYTFCADLLKVIASGNYNTELFVVDVTINIPNSDELIVYPLDEEQSNELLSSAMLSGIDVYQHKQSYMDIQDAKERLDQWNKKMLNY